MENFEEGKYYEGLGIYLSIITVYPYDKDYKEIKHKFAEHPKDGRSSSKINELLIERVKREDR